MRLDQALMERGQARSRSQAKELIENSFVRVNQKIVTKASYKVEEQDQIIVTDNIIQNYVSRAGLKLEGAINDLALKVSGKKCLDIGSSTGGFSDCLLKAGVASVIGVDVGHDQLAPELVNEKRLENHEGVNAREIANYKETIPGLDLVDLVVMDVSFISITKIIPGLSKLYSNKNSLELLSLVKPQFELDKKSLSKQGIVKDEDSYVRVEQNIRNSLEENGFLVKKFFESQIVGGDGNKEFFVYATIADSRS